MTKNTLKIAPAKIASVDARRMAQVMREVGGSGRAINSQPRCRRWLLKLDGEVIGSGGLETFADSAVLIAGAVFPEARQKGIQSAFINYRLRVARELGLGYVLVASVPNGGTERNTTRIGFVPAMTFLGLRRRRGPTKKP